MTPDEIQQIVETAIQQKMMFPWWAYVLWALITFVSCFIVVYLKEKGKNLATKEDISEITKKIEAAKLDYSSKLESVKTTLGSKLFITQVRYQNEFDLLVNLSKKLATFRNAVLNFEILVRSYQQEDFNYASAKKSAEEVLAALGILMEEYEGNKPFYPEEIYECMIELHRSGFDKVLLTLDEKNLVGKDWFTNISLDKAKNRNQIDDSEYFSKICEEIHEAIRRRVQYWEESDLIGTHPS